MKFEELQAFAHKYGMFCFIEGYIPYNETKTMYVVQLLYHTSNSNHKYIIGMGFSKDDAVKQAHKSLVSIYG